MPGLLFISANADGLKEPSTTRQPMQPGGFVLENISSPGVSQFIFQPMIWLCESVTTPNADAVTFDGVKVVRPSVKLKDSGEIIIRIGVRGAATVKEPLMWHTGGQVNVPPD